MAMSWTWRGERPRTVCPYFASSAAVKWALSSTSPCFKSPSYCDDTSAVLDTLVVCAISGSTPILSIFFAARNHDRMLRMASKVDLRLGKMPQDTHPLYTSLVSTPQVYHAAVPDL